MVMGCLCVCVCVCVRAGLDEEHLSEKMKGDKEQPEHQLHSMPESFTWRESSLLCN